MYGAFLLACYDPDSENFQTICKIGTGFSDEFLAQSYETLQPLEIENVRGDSEESLVEGALYASPVVPDDYAPSHVVLAAPPTGTAYVHHSLITLRIELIPGRQSTIDHEQSDEPGWEEDDCLLELDVQQRDGHGDQS